MSVGKRHGVGQGEQGLVSMGASALFWLTQPELHPQVPGQPLPCPTKTGGQPLLWVHGSPLDPVATQQQVGAALGLGLSGAGRGRQGRRCSCPHRTQQASQLEPARPRWGSVLAKAAAIGMNVYVSFQQISSQIPHPGSRVN